MQNVTAFFSIVEKNYLCSAMRQIIAFLFFLLLISASFAGAIFSHEGTPDYKTAPAPTFFFHGTEDKLVAYNKIRFFNKGLFGTKSLVKRFEKMGFTYRVFRYVGYGHEIAERNVADVTTFIMNPGAIKSVDCTINDTTIPHSKIGGASPDSYYKK